MISSSSNSSSSTVSISSVSSSSSSSLSSFSCSLNSAINRRRPGWLAPPLSLPPGLARELCDSWLKRALAAFSLLLTCMLVFALSATEGIPDWLKRATAAAALTTFP
eukprot:1159763-Pelagomonas_calceolata.AAC.10